MNATDIVAYIHMGDILCVDCAKRVPQRPLIQPVFASEEWDYIPSCYDCGALIEGVTLIKREET